jgi:hypothetical protein
MLDRPLLSTALSMVARGTTFTSGSRFVIKLYFYPAFCRALVAVDNSFSQKHLILKEIGIKDFR